LAMAMSVRRLRDGRCRVASKRSCGTSQPEQAERRSADECEPDQEADESGQHRWVAAFGDGQSERAGRAPASPKARNVMHKGALYQDFSEWEEGNRAPVFSLGKRGFSDRPVELVPGKTCNDLVIRADGALPTEPLLTLLTAT
jgi:hypothetical protein